MSSHGKDAVRLCEHVVREAFGNVVCRIASILLNRGRLPLPSIARLSNTPRPTTCSALLILMQHNLVQTNGASRRESPDEEMYEFVVEECVNRLRWGRILAMTEARMGLAARDIVQSMMIYGRMTAGNVVEVMGVGKDAKRLITVNEALTSLVRNSLLVPTTPELQVLRSDVIARRVAVLRSQKMREKGMSVPSAADMANMIAQATHEVDEDREKQRSIHNVLIKTTRVVKSRKKKGEEEFEYSLKQNVMLRINYDRYMILLRDELVVKAAEDRWNKGAAQVMRAVLEASLNEESSISDSRTHTEVGFNEIIDKIPNKLYPMLAAGIAGSSSKSTAEIVRQYLSLLAGEDQMIANGGTFLKKEGSSVNPGYKVELEFICIRLRASLLSDLVRQRLGEKAARVLAVVAKAQKASEHTVRDCAMIPLAEARRTLSDLQKLSIVETQEVPKTAAKMRTGLPSSAEYHLWQVDLARVYNLQLVGVYKTLGNIIQRRSREMEKREVVLEREARSKDQGGRERLQGKDQEDLQELDGIVRKLGLTQIRCDLVAFILRDLPGWSGRV